MKRDWARVRQRELLLRRGHEGVGGGVPPFMTPLIRPRPKPRRIPKVELREQAARALANYEGQITRCPPGRKR
jgi:hypothetical protein